ncbi:MAG: addiction module protein [Verrucomicrobia bacterium]|nr:addiction module protein [Verrucomicrobiota bacterium]
MIEAAEIEKMSLDERLQTMELLWTSIARTPDAVPSPAWHGEILATRMAKIGRGEAEFLTVAELKERLQKSTR